MGTTFIPLTQIRAHGRAAVVIALPAAVAFIILLALGEGQAIVTGALGVGVIVLLARRLGLTRADSSAAWIVAASLSGHLLLLVAVHLVLVSAGRGGFVTGDDYGYFDLSSRLAQHLHGVDVPINWSAEAYLINNYFVQLETWLFYLVGPHVLVVKVINVVMLHISALLLYDVGRRRFSRGAATVATALTLFFPSLTLWSVLNLKDVLTLFLIVVVLSSASRYLDRPAFRWLILAVATLVVLEGVRRYVFLLLALLLPLGVILSVRSVRDLRPRLPQLVATVVVCGVLMAVSGSGFLGMKLLNVQTFADMENSRGFMAAGARTAIGDAALPQIAKAGDHFVVVTEAPAVASSPSSAPSGPIPTPRVFVVQPFTRILLEGSADAQQAISGKGQFSQFVVVRPGDIVVVDGAPVSSAPPQPLVVGAERRPAPEIRTDESLSTPSVISRTLAYAPTGLAYALFAPFPWAASGGSERLALIDMAVWYLALVAAIATVWQQRRSLRFIALPLLYIIGVLVILALFEGNVGTLFRHRAMVAPIVVLLAGPTLSRWLPSRIRGSVGA